MAKLILLALFVLALIPGSTFAAEKQLSVPQSGVNVAVYCDTSTHCWITDINGTQWGIHRSHYSFESGDSYFPVGVSFTANMKSPFLTMRGTLTWWDSSPDQVGYAYFFND